MSTSKQSLVTTHRDAVGQELKIGDLCWEFWRSPYRPNLVFIASYARNAESKQIGVVYLTPHFSETFDITKHKNAKDLLAHWRHPRIKTALIKMPKSVALDFLRQNGDEFNYNWDVEKIIQGYQQFMNMLMPSTPTEIVKEFNEENE
jgi:hypothetical protein